MTPATATPTDRPSWLDLPAATITRLLTDATALHDDDVTALLDAGLYTYEQRHIGGRGSIGYIFPTAALPGAPEWRERRVNLHCSYWE